MIQTTDTSERGLERLIAGYLTDTGGYKTGRPDDYDRNRGIDKAQFFRFLRDTQPEEVEKLKRIHGSDYQDRFAQRLHERLRKRGLLHILRNGIRDRDAKLTLYYPRPSFGESFNEKAWSRYQANRFSVTRQLRFKEDASESVDLAIFVNGLPVATMELKNNLTKQSVRDARRQYRGRDTSATLFQFRRCLVHFAVDDQLVSMTTELDGPDTNFLPFNKGTENDGAGNPPNPDGLKTAYLWEDVLSKGSLNDILLKYAQLFEEKDEEGATKEKLIFPRYHQRDAVQQLLAHAEQHGPGRRYLIQHSTGSGKSFTITWLAHQLAELTDAASEDVVFNTVIVVTDRVHLDRQIRNYIQQIDQKRGIVEAITKGSRQLKDALESGKKIITSTVQKFPHIVEEIGKLDQSSFAIVIDEAHSSQGGSFTAALNRVLGDVLDDQDFDTVEDALNALAESRKMPLNASYFAFTATPKEKTLELFGEVHSSDDEPQPFHTYTMKQAIEEGFIMDVLENYTTIDSYYKLLETAKDDPLVDKRRAHQQLRHFVETHKVSIKQKARVMIDHFREEVVRKGKVGGRARAMVVTRSRELAIRYYWAFQTYLGELNSSMQAIVAFSDTKKVDGQEYTEAKLNGFSGDKIPDQFRKKPYRFLVVADKYQTGYDEPLLHTMYVDKPLGGVNAVQTLSRLNRTHPDKTDTFVLDFQNDVDKIKNAFDDYYTKTLLEEPTDPNRLSNLEEELDNDFGVYTENNVTVLTDLFLKGADRDELDPILDTCRERFDNELDADEQRLFKQKARAFVRSYGFLSQIMTFEVAYWERLYYFLKFLLDKLPALEREDPDVDVLQHVDMESYRVEKRAAEQIQLDEAEARLKPKGEDVPGKVGEPKQEYLSQVVQEFNERFGTKWTENDKIRNFLFEELPDSIAGDEEFVRKIQSSDRQNARITVEERVVDEFQDLIMTHTDLYKKFTDDPEFKAFVQAMVFEHVYEVEQSAGG
jgi:type I restriction enzyme R subunit